MSIVRSMLRKAVATAALMLVLAIPALFPQEAHAQQCWVPNSFGLQFGAVDGGGASTISNMESHCLPDYGSTTYYYHICLYLNPGEFSSGQSRRMYNYTSQTYLNYDVFSDPAHTVRIGGVGSGEPVRVSMVVPPGGGTAVTITPFYGLVLPGQAVPAGHYEEQNTSGVIRYRYSSAPFQASDDCLSGGLGGSSSIFSSSGVRATYDNSCWVVATDMDFGQVEPPKSPLYETSSIRVNCAPGAEWRVGLSDGQFHDGQTRRMYGSGGYIKYQLYTDESHTHVWADDQDQNRVSGKTDVAGNTVTLSVYGEVPPQPDARAGQYVDTVIATLYY